MTKNSVAQKEVTVLARFEFKGAPEKVVYRVLSGNSKDTYQTFFHRGKACSCSCPSKKPCYHMVQLEAKEQARNAAAIENASAYARYQFGYHD